MSGFVSLPELTRANRNYISLFINGRYIKNFLLNRAILDGYGSKLMVGRFPIAVINIQIDPYLADVNVHPTKQEVRISKERELMALISQAIVSALKEQDLIPDALENLAKSTLRRTEKPVQTSLPLKENSLYYDRDKGDFFVRPEVAESQPSGELTPEQTVLFAPEEGNQEAKSPAIKFAERKHLLEEVGVYLEEYGANQLILREHPIWMKEEEIESGIYEMCDMLLLTKEVSIKKYRAELAIMMSCKRSIKANHTLDDYSARDLIYQLSQCDNPYNCPHGRPVLVNFTKSDMEKMFRRIQENHTSLRELGKY